MPGMRTHRLFEYSPVGAIAVVSGDIAIRKHAAIGF